MENALKYLIFILPLIGFIWGIIQFFLKRKLENKDKYQTQKLKVYTEIQAVIDAIYNDFLLIFVSDNIFLSSKPKLNSNREDMSVLEETVDELGDKLKEIDKELKKQESDFSIIELKQLLENIQKNKLTLNEVDLRVKNTAKNMDNVNETIEAVFISQNVQMAEKLKLRLRSLSEIKGITIFSSKSVLSRVLSLKNEMAYLSSLIKSETDQIVLGQKKIDKAEMSRNLYSKLFKLFDETSNSIRKELN